ncbi:hypothetical protein IV102_35305 [bacterium]|nr:hypothetical protein [bacterium]
MIPYVHLLTFPDQWLRSRRDHDRFLHLIADLRKPLKECHPREKEGPGPS